jgi:hypothetical protein
VTEAQGLPVRRRLRTPPFGDIVAASASLIRTGEHSGHFCPPVIRVPRRLKLWPLCELGQWDGALGSLFHGRLGETLLPA